MTQLRLLRRFSLRLAVLALVAAGSVVLVPLPAAVAEHAPYTQCNGFASGGTGGATTGMICEITVVNTINGPNKSSTVTVSRNCTGGVDNACPFGANTGGGNTPGPGNPVMTTHPGHLTTSVDQCNGSANGAAITTPPIRCTVRITNNISADQAGTIGIATVNQCNNADATAAKVCDPATATTTDATVTQCNESARGGGGTVDCFFEVNVDMTDPKSKVSSNLPISINQCNATGNPGGSYVVCESFLTTNVTAAYVAPGTTGGTPTTTGGTPTTTGGTPTTTGGTPTTTGGSTAGTGGATAGGASGGQVFPIPQGGVAAGTGPASSRLPALTLGLLLLLAAGGVALRSRQRS